MGKNRNQTEKQLANLKRDAGPGRPKGQSNFATIYRAAIAKIAASKNITADEFEIELVEQAIRKGFNGDTRFYTDTLDRIHGKAVQSIDHTTNGESINAPVLDAGLVKEYEEKLRLKMLNGDTTRTS